MMRIKPGQKYETAKLWVFMNRERITPYAKVNAMHKETLYAFLESLNVRWSTARKYWYTIGGASDPLQSRRKKPVGAFTINNKISIRITAHNSVMTDILAEFTELCEALDWHASISPKRYPNTADGYERAYVEVDHNRR